MSVNDWRVRYLEVDGAGMRLDMYKTMVGVELTETDDWGSLKNLTFSAALEIPKDKLSRVQFEDRPAIFMVCSDFSYEAIFEF